MTQWVRSKYDETAPKWKVSTNGVSAYHARMDGGDVLYDLPKSEYIPCAPPEQWQECTREVVKVDTDGRLRVHGVLIALSWDNERWAWKGHALVIERKVEG